MIQKYIMVQDDMKLVFVFTEGGGGMMHTPYFHTIIQFSITQHTIKVNREYYVEKK